MTLVPNPIIAKQDRPPYGAIGPVMPGKYAQRWVVVYATEIVLCELLALEDGVLVKYDDWSQAGDFSSCTWLRLNFESDLSIFMARYPAYTPLNWQLSVSGVTPARVALTSWEQPSNVQLWQEAESDELTFFGDWGVDDPIGSLGWQMFKTEADALDTWPDALQWSW